MQQANDRRIGRLWKGWKECSRLRLLNHVWSIKAVACFGDRFLLWKAGLTPLVFGQTQQLHLANNLSAASLPQRGHPILVGDLVTQ